MKTVQKNLPEVEIIIIEASSLEREAEFNLFQNVHVVEKSEVSKYFEGCREEITEMSLFFTHSNNKNRLFLFNEIINHSGFVPMIWGVREVRDNFNRPVSRELWNISREQKFELIDLSKKEIIPYMPALNNKDMTCSWNPSKNRFHIRITVPKKITDHTTKNKARRKFARNWQNEILASVSSLRMRFGFFAVDFSYNQLSNSNSITQTLRRRFEEEFVREG